MAFLKKYAYDARSQTNFDPFRSVRGVATLDHELMKICPTPRLVQRQVCVGPIAEGIVLYGVIHCCGVCFRVWVHARMRFWVCWEDAGGRDFIVSPAHTIDSSRQVPLFSDFPSPPYCFLLWYPNLPSSWRVLQIQPISYRCKIPRTDAS